MALGTFAVLDQVASVGPVFHVRATIVGDGAYTAGGTTGLLAKLKTALHSTVAILAVMPAGDNLGYTPVYDHAAEKLKVYYNDNNNASDGAAIEDTTADQSARTYTLYIVAK